MTDSHCKYHKHKSGKNSMRSVDSRDKKNNQSRQTVHLSCLLRLMFLLHLTLKPHRDANTTLKQEPSREMINWMAAVRWLRSTRLPMSKHAYHFACECTQHIWRFIVIWWISSPIWQFQLITARTAMRTVCTSVRRFHIFYWELTTCGGHCQNQFDARKYKSFGAHFFSFSIIRRCFCRFTCWWKFWTNDSKMNIDFSFTRSPHRIPKKCGAVEYCVRRLRRVQAWNL